MRLGSFRWKILLIIISILLLWQSSKVWLNLTQGKSSIEALYSTASDVPDANIVKPKDDSTIQKVHIAVYYEALCPDSRSFFIKQLLPTYQKIPDNIQVELIPYGKATTLKTDHGYTFLCQHGPIECEANIVHACSIDIIKNSSVQLEYLSCMIRNNIQPFKVMDSCAKMINIDYNSILKCSTETRGKELLAKYGEVTNALIPRISFIPTVTLDGNSQNQAGILKNLLHEVCLHLKVMPESCIS